MKQVVIAASAMLIALSQAHAYGQTTRSGPEKGANSFTEIQAADRIAAAGYAAVGGLTKDADGIWRGHAMKSGRSIAVWVDFKGRVGPS